MSQISQMAKYLISVLMSFNQISYLTIKEYKYTPSFFLQKDDSHIKNENKTIRIKVNQNSIRRVNTSLL